MVGGSSRLLLKLFGTLCFFMLVLILFLTVFKNSMILFIFSSRGYLKIGRYMTPPCITSMSSLCPKNNEHRFKDINMTNTGSKHMPYLENESCIVWLLDTYLAMLPPDCVFFYMSFGEISISLSFHISVKSWVLECIILTILFESNCNRSYVYQ